MSGALLALTLIVYPIDDALRQAAVRNKVPYKLIRAVCKVESNLDPYVINEDDGGGDSIGLCQMKEKTARYVGFEGEAEDLFDPYMNAEFAARYLKRLLTKCAIRGTIEGTISKQVCAIASYNAGRLKWKNGRLVNETYVKRVMEALKNDSSSKKASNRNDVRSLR